MTAETEISELASLYEVHLRGDGKSPKTRATYAEGIRSLTNFLIAHERPTTIQSVTQRDITEWIVEQREQKSPATALTRLGGVRGLFRYAVTNDEITSSPVTNAPKPKVPEHATRVITDDELRAVLAACAGKTFTERRDLALIRLFMGTGVRLNEIAGLRLDDVNLDSGTIHVTRKGGAEQNVGISGNKPVEALSWYVRARSRHRDAHSTALWLGQDGAMTGPGIAKAIARRGREAGLEWRLHPHSFRATFAAHWIEGGAPEVELARAAGWKAGGAMIARYTRSGGVERAANTSRRLRIADRF